MDKLEQLTIHHIYTVLDNKKYKDLLTTKLNEHIDIPFINEATEQFIIDAIYNCVLNALEFQDEKE